MNLKKLIKVADVRKPVSYEDLTYYDVKKAIDIMYCGKSDEECQRYLDQADNKELEKLKVVAEHLSKQGFDYKHWVRLTAKEVAKRGRVKANKPNKSTVQAPTSLDPREQFADKLGKERTLHLLEYDSAVDGADKVKPNLSGAEAAELFLSARYPKNMYFFKDRGDFDLACELVDEICANYTGDPNQSYTVINRLGDDLYELKKNSLNFKG